MSKVRRSNKMFKPNFGIECFASFCSVAASLFRSIGVWDFWNLFQHGPCAAWKWQLHWIYQTKTIVHKTSYYTQSCCTSKDASFFCVLPFFIDLYIVPVCSLNNIGGVQPYLSYVRIQCCASTLPPKQKLHTPWIVTWAKTRSIRSWFLRSMMESPKIKGCFFRLVKLIVTVRWLQIKASIGVWDGFVLFGLLINWTDLKINTLETKDDLIVSEPTMK